METVERPTSTPAASEIPVAAGIDGEPLREDLFAGGDAGTRWRFTVEEYHRMAEAGIFGEDDRVELLDGDIIVMSPIGPSHASVCNRLIPLLVSTFAGQAIVTAGNPVQFGGRSEPQPDFTLLHPRDDFYRSARPTPADVFLVIEVMDSSAHYDRGEKLTAYARAGLREVWLVDVNTGKIETYRRPSGETYDEKHTVSRGQSLAPEAFPETPLEVDAILG